MIYISRVWVDSEPRVHCDQEVCVCVCVCVCVVVGVELTWFPWKMVQIRSKWRFPGRVHREGGRERERGAGECCGVQKATIWLTTVPHGSVPDFRARCCRPDRCGCECRYRTWPMRGCNRQSRGWRAGCGEDSCLCVWWRSPSKSGSCWQNTSSVSVFCFIGRRACAI
jgi:hypothetical protein